MKLARTNTSPIGELGFKYEQMIWGDVIQGTKGQLQRIGLAVGMAFPGEAGAPKKAMRILDHTGFTVKVERNPCYDDGTYIAYRSFPGRDPAPPRRWTDYAPGVIKRSDIYWCDEYIGTAAALAAAGLVRLDQLPGEHGMRKTRVTIWPDGTPQGGKTSNHSAAKEPGAKQIERASKDKYRVRVHVSEDEEQRRYNENQAATREWRARMQALPRPAPLIALPNDGRSCATPRQVPKYRADGNVLYLLPRADRMPIR